MTTDDAAPIREPRSEPIGVPRRFAVGTLMVIVTMYSVLFAFLTSLGANPVIFGTVAVFFSGVGVGQVVFFRGTRPRDASYLSGMLLCPGIFLVFLVADLLLGLPGELSLEDVNVRMIAGLLSAMAYLTILGVPLGYAAGCATAGVFFVMDRIQRAREDSGGETDPSSPGVEEVVSQTRPGLDERVWFWLRAKAAAFSPRQKGRPVRGAVNIFIIVAVLIGLAAPLPLWAWWIHLLGAAAAALLLGFLRGLFLCRWWVVLLFVLLGALGAIVPGQMLRGIFLDPFVYSVERIGELVSFGPIILCGCLVGSLAAATLGWAGWYRRRGGRPNQRRSVTVAGVAAPILGLSLFYGALSLWLDRVSQQPEQQVLALVDRVGGYARNSSGKPGPLDYVDFDGAHVDDEDLECLSGLQALARLDLSSTGISDAGLAHLRSLPALERLDLARTGITDGGLKDLRDLGRLTFLSLSYCRISDDGLVHLIPLKRMEQLQLDETRINDAGLQHLGSMASLWSLDLSSTRVTGEGLEHLDHLTNLWSLDLSASEVTDEGLANLKRLKGLTKLNLSNTRISDAGLEHLKPLTNLVTLYLDRTQITGIGLENLGDLSELCYMSLTGSPVTDEGLQHLQKMPSLAMLLLDDTHVTGKGLEHLKKLSRLKSLALGGCRVGDDGLVHLAELGSLSELVLADTQVGDAGLKDLKGLTSLGRLDLSGTRVTDAGLIHLKGLKNLETLHLWATRISNAGIGELEDALPNCTIYEPSGEELDDYAPPPDDGPLPE